MKIDSLLTGLHEFITDVVFKNVPKLILALVVLWIGLKLIKVLAKGIKKLMQRRNVDVSLQDFLCSLVDIALKVLLIITVMGMIGIQMTSFIAVIGAAGLAVGMALQGTLQNFAGGVIVLLMRPYRVGDFIEQGGISGTVSHIQIFNTTLNTPDNKVIIVPNTELATKTLINYSTSDTRRADIKVGIAYGESIESARATMLEIAKNCSMVLADPAAMVCVTTLDDSAIKLELRVWVKQEHYWDTLSELNQAVYEKFQSKGIKIPYNQLDVHVVKE